MTNDELEQRLRAWFRDEVGFTETAPPEVQDQLDAMIAIDRPPLSASRRGFIVLAAAAMLLVALIGVAIAIGTGVFRPIPPNPLRLDAAADWSPTGDMIAGRIYNSATLLPDGTVLVAGGGTGANYTVVASAELFDPRTRSWSRTGTMHEARMIFAATSLSDGSVLVTGGLDANGQPLASAERFDPQTGTWTVMADMAAARSGHTVTLLRNGTVLVAGGSDGTDAQSAAELFDPDTGTWSSTGPMVEARNLHTATLMPDGRVLVAGGYGFRPERPLQDLQTPRAATISAELYDPRTGSWTATGQMVTPLRLGHTATLLPGGMVLVAGGAVWLPRNNTRGDALDSTELYDASTGTWMAARRMTLPREDPTATLLPDGSVLVVSGVNLADSVGATTAELYDPQRGTWMPAAGLNTARSFQTAALLADGRVVIIGGLGSVEGDSNLLQDAEIYGPEESPAADGSE